MADHSLYFVLQVGGGSALATLMIRELVRLVSQRRSNGLERRLDQVHGELREIRAAIQQETCCLVEMTARLEPYGAALQRLLESVTRLEERTGHGP